MADTIVEFINASGKTLAELQAGVPIVVNAANEQAVVKDVVIACTKNRALTLDVGGSAIASVSGSARLTGSELLAAGNQLNLKTALKVLLNFCYSTDGSGTFYKNQFETLFSGDGGSSTVASVAAVTSLTGIVVTPYFICIAANGDFYYADGSNGTLYRRTGGPTGAETSFGSFGHTLCYDGSRYIYGFNTSGQIKTFDTQSATVTNTQNLTGSWNQPSSGYAHCCTIDGWVWCHPGYNQTSFLVNPANGICYSFGGYASASAQRYFVGVNKDSAGNYVFVQVDYSSPGLYYWSPGKTLGANPSMAFSGSLSTVSFSPYSGNANFLHRIPGVDNLLFYIGSSKVQVLDLTTLSIAVSLTLSGYQGGNYGTFYGTDAARAATDFGTVSVRATGIKVTP